MTTEQTNAVSMGREVLANSQDINNVLTTSNIVKTVFHTHFVSMENNLAGIADLISTILREHDAIFPLNSSQTELRPIAIAGAMFTNEILEEVQTRFTAGSKRYPLQTVKNYLSTYMPKTGKVGKIQLSGKEDVSRSCPKPRCKWFLVQ
jgi:hypothetical protein